MHYFKVLAAVVAIATLSARVAQAADHPHTAYGFDFDEVRRYEAGKKAFVQFHRGTTGGEYAWEIQDVRQGTLGGKSVALVIEHQDGPGGYNEAAYLYLVSGNHVRLLGGLGDFSYFSTGDGPQPQSWSAYTFSQERLYADMFSRETECDPKRDWLVTTYELRSGKLIAVDKLYHHRSGMPVPKKYGGAKWECAYN